MVHAAYDCRDGACHGAGRVVMDDLVATAIFLVGDAEGGSSAALEE